MILIKYRDGQGTIRLMPDREKDKPLFLHCTNGSWSYPNKGFNKMVLPILKAHGVFHIKIINKVGTKSRRK